MKQVTIGEVYDALRKANRHVLPPKWDDLNRAQEKLLEQIASQTNAVLSEPSQWKRYRKTALVTACILTDLDFKMRRGVIHTLEGERAFQPGDYLARDSKGSWPIQKTKIEQIYLPIESQRQEP